MSIQTKLYTKHPCGRFCEVYSNEESGSFVFYRHKCLGFHFYIMNDLLTFIFYRTFWLLSNYILLILYYNILSNVIYTKSVRYDLFIVMWWLDTGWFLASSFLDQVYKLMALSFIFWRLSQLWKCSCTFIFSSLPFYD